VLPASITVTGSAIALIGTLGERCCEPGHARVFVDGRETVDGTGIWQNKSSSGKSLPGSVLFAWRWLPESKKKRDESLPPDTQPRQPLSQAIWEVVRYPSSPVASLIWVYAFGMMAFMAMNGILALYLGAEYQVNEKNIGIFYTYVGAVSVVMRAILLGPTIRRFGEVGVMRMGAFALVLGLAGMPLVGSIDASRPVRLALLAIVVLCVPVGTALLFPATTALVSWRGRQEEMGQIMGVQQFMGAVARVVGPLWAGVVFEKDVRYPFWIAAALMLGVTGLTWRQKESPVAPDAVPEQA